MIYIENKKWGKKMVVGFFNRPVSELEMAHLSDMVEDSVDFAAIDLQDIFDGGLYLDQLSRPYSLDDFLRIAELIILHTDLEIEITHISEGDFYTTYDDEPSSNVMCTYTIKTKDNNILITYRGDYPTDENYNEWVNKRKGYFYGEDKEDL